MTAAPPDWYPDPSGSGGLRYWDGQQWTGHLDPGPHHAPYGSPGAGMPHPLAPQPAPGGATTPDGARLAGWWHRVGAALLDNILIGLLCLPITISAQVAMQDRLQAVADEFQRRVDANDSGAFGWFVRQMVDLLQHYAWQYAGTAAVAFVVTAICLRVWGGTPGKLITGLRVRRRDRPGNLGWSRAAARALLYPALNSVLLFAALASGVAAVVGLVALAAFLWSLVDPLWAAADSKKQTLHDKIVGTNVVRVR